ncbi:MAG: hypothetical protein QOH13_963 [Thermoleophilaceae bacterium]|nr:hypothetical protein [Thermoleophilaceae bacterium]
MRPRPHLVLLALALAALICPAAASAKKHAKPPKTYSVGMAARSVNLDANGTFANQLVYLGGYGLGNGRVLDHFGNVDNPGPRPADNGIAYDDGRHATGNLADGIHVRAAVISAGKQNFAIADIETQGCFTQNKQGYGLVTMRLAVQQRTGGALPADHVDIQCDHSHGGPDLIGAWGGVPNEYLKYVQEQTIDAIVEAFKTQRPAELWYGTAQSGVAGRDKLPEDKTDPLLTNQMLNDPTGANEVMDDELRVLQARDPKTGTPFATILNLNAHPTVLGSSNTKASGDWPQFANTLMTQDAASFGSQALTVVGTLGRQQPARGDCPDAVLAQKGDSDPQEAICKLTAYAERVVKRAKVALAAAKPLDGKPEVVAKTYLIQDAATNAGIMSFNLAGDLIGVPIMRSTTTPWLTGTVVGSVTGSARIGSVLFSSMPGEAYPQIPLAVRDALKDSGIKGFMTAGLSNDQLGYIIATLPEAYPQVLVKGAQGNDNILFNMSQTLGERLICSLLRGAGEVTGRGQQYWQGYSKCVAFANDLASPEGADVAPFPVAK